MSLKTAAFWAFLGTTLLTLRFAVAFIRDFSAFLSGAVAAVEILVCLIYLLASLSVAVFLYVFYKAQS
jgi:hypothetical protein